MKRRDLLRATLACCVVSRACAQSLYAQSIRTALANSAAGEEILLLDLRSHETLADTFANAQKEIPVGSLLKPFLALAYGQKHAAAFPVVVCRGRADRCWKPEGHGRMTLVPAIAQSCNAYFLALARGLGPAGVAAMPYLPTPPRDASAETLLGLAPDWRITPARLVEAYAAVLTGPSSSTQAAVLAGMRDSATTGTAAHIGTHRGGVLAKTGTATCVEDYCRASGDGLVVAAMPAMQPALVLLVRKRATTGATTAAAAGLILSKLESLHAV